ncbi:MAG: AzlD domain-containing protein [Candidatus Binatia bacterium]
MDTTRIAIIVGMGLVTYLIRVVPQIFFVGRSFPEALDRYLRYLAYALIGSVISTSLFLSGSRFEAAAAPQRIVALLAAIIVASWSGRPLLGMLAGTLIALAFPWLQY